MRRRYSPSAEGTGTAAGFAFGRTCWRSIRTSVGTAEAIAANCAVVALGAASEASTAVEWAHRRTVHRPRRRRITLTNKPRRAGPVWVRKGWPLAAREAETGESDAEKRERGRLGDNGNDRGSYNMVTRVGNALV